MPGLRESRSRSRFSLWASNISREYFQVYATRRLAGARWSWSLVTPGNSKGLRSRPASPVLQSRGNVRRELRLPIVSELGRWSSTSRTKVYQLIQPLPAANPGICVLDIGSNDGTLLSFYPQEDLTVVGIDPTAQKFASFIGKHIPLIPDFFSARACSAKKFGTKRARIVTSIAMFYDLENPLSFMEDVTSILEQGRDLALRDELPAGAWSGQWGTTPFATSTWSTTRCARSNG